MSLFFTDKIKNHKGPELIFKITYKDKKIEIFGEEHQSLIDEDNIYEELLKHEDYKDALVLVEHPTVLCRLFEGDDEIFEKVIKKVGPELIFYKSIKMNLDNFVCIDNRIESGLFSKIDEDKYDSMIPTVITMEPSKDSRKIMSTFLLLLKSKVDIFKENQEYYKSIEEVYNVYMEGFQRQLDIIEKISKMLIRDLKKNDILDNPDISNFELGMITVLNLYNNIKLLSSITVDILISNFIENTDRKNVLIFVGLNHAIRLHASKLLFSKDNKIIISEKYGKKGFDFMQKLFNDAIEGPLFNKSLEDNILSYFE